MQYIEANLLVKDISKERFYKESGITTASMSQWRSGKHNPSEKAVKKAEDFFNKFENKNFPLAAQNLPLISASSIAKEKNSTPEGMELSETQSVALDLIMNMSEDQLKKFIQLAEIALEIPSAK